MFGFSFEIWITLFIKNTLSEIFHWALSDNLSPKYHFSKQYDKNVCVRIIVRTRCVSKKNPRAFVKKGNYTILILKTSRRTRFPNLRDEQKVYNWILRPISVISRAIFQRLVLYYIMPGPGPISWDYGLSDSKTIKHANSFTLTIVSKNLNFSLWFQD